MILGKGSQPKSKISSDTTEKSVTETKTERMKPPRGEELTVSHRILHCNTGSCTKNPPHFPPNYIFLPQVGLR